MFGHLHVHSFHSKNCGIEKINHLLQKAENDKQPFMGLTDHHTTFGWWELHEGTKESQVKPLYGMECHVGSQHITLFAKNENGMNCISKLQSLGYEKGNRPRVTEKQFYQNLEDVVVLSGCANGKLHYWLNQGRYEKAKEEIEGIKQIIGNDYFIELQYFKQPETKNRLKELIQLATETKTVPIPTNDSHYLYQHDHPYQAHYVSMKTKGKIHQPNTENYFKTYEEMKQVFPVSVLNMTKTVSEKCEVDFSRWVQSKHGGCELPITMVYYYDDAESIKKVFFHQKDYKRGEYFSQKLKKEGKKLEDLLENVSIRQQVELAMKLRGRIKEYLPDPYYYIRVDETFPRWRKNKESGYAASIDYWSVLAHELPLYDRRKTSVAM